MQSMRLKDIIPNRINEMLFAAKDSEIGYGGPTTTVRIHGLLHTTPKT